MHGKHFFNYKSNYSLNALAIVDHNKKVRYLNLGWVGCAHDQKVMENSEVGDRTSLVI